MAKKAIVTGGGTGIGKQIAITLLKNGYDVAVSYCNSGKNMKELDEISVKNG